MSQQKGNAYPNWVINNQHQIYAYDSGSKAYQMSDTDFAIELGIAEDGTVWALSTQANSNGSGSLIYYGSGTDKWTKVSDTIGGFAIAGGSGSSCYYINGDRNIVLLGTDGTTTVVYSGNDVIAMDYGGGYVWALILDTSKGTIGIFYAKESTSLSFTQFTQAYQPSGISVDYDGNCYAVVKLSPMIFSNDGYSVSSPGTGADDKTLQISSKNWTYLVSTDIDTSENGNVIMVWQDKAGGTFVPTKMYGMKVFSTYYTP